MECKEACWARPSDYWPVQTRHGDARMLASMQARRRFAVVGKGGRRLSCGTILGNTFA